MFSLGPIAITKTDLSFALIV